MAKSHYDFTGYASRITIYYTKPHILFMKLWMLLAALLVISPVFADLTANATISPRYVDTSVINQTFVYTIVPLNETLINRTVISAPAGYQIVSLQDVTLGVTNDSCLSTACTQREINSTQITVNFSSVINNSVNSPVIITFLVNTSSSAVTGNFTSSIHNNTHNATGASGLNYTIVVTQPMLNISTAMTKGTAIINGTDYWEFRFDLLYNAAQDGLVQFRMNNWIDSAGQTMNILLSNGTTYATLSNQSNLNTTAKFSINTTYANSVGINRTNIPGSLYLRMFIPLGANLSSTWSSTYNFLFRAYP